MLAMPRQVCIQGRLNGGMKHRLATIGGGVSSGNVRERRSFFRTNPHLTTARIGQ